MSFWLASRAMDRAVLPSCFKVRKEIRASTHAICQKRYERRGGGVDGNVKTEMCAHVVGQSGITAWHRQQLTHNVHMAVLAGAHEGRGAVVVADVDLCPTGKQSPHHVSSTVAYC